MSRISNSRVPPPAPAQAQAPRPSGVDPSHVGGPFTVLYGKELAFVSSCGAVSPTLPRDVPAAQRKALEGAAGFDFGPPSTNADFRWPQAPKGPGSEGVEGVAPGFVSQCGLPARSLPREVTADQLQAAQQHPGFDFGQASEGIGNFVQSRAPSPTGRERVSPLIAAFVEQHGLSEHIDTVRRGGRVELSSADAKALEDKLDELNVAQRQALREALVPRGSERANRHTRNELLQGRPDASKLVKMFDGALM